MKKIHLVIVALLVSSGVFAQSQLVATLSHGDEISMYSGINAFVKAVAAAEDGDIINLSGGNFNGTTIDKGLTIQGAGIASELPTTISTATNIASSHFESSLKIEGISFANSFVPADTMNAPYFSKCRFSSFGSASYTTLNNAVFVNCIVEVSFLNYLRCNNVLFANCYLSTTNNASSSSNISCVNCVARGIAGNVSYYNCIHLYTLTSGTIPSGVYAENCICLLASGSAPSGYSTSMAGSNNQYLGKGIASVFKTYTGSAKPDATVSFELTDEAKSLYLGNDSTEVGMYGGALPYTPTPSYPIIKKMDVSLKASADGKVSVDLEISTPE